MTNDYTSLAKIIDPTWAQVLSKYQPILDKISNELNNLSNQGKRYAPPGSSILKAFTMPIAATKIIIIGQDPYPTPGQANGLAFSVNPDVNPLPPSLENIFIEYQSDLGYPRPTSGDLTPWFHQGVLLLNRSLTTLVGSPGAHEHLGWAQITTAAIDALALQNSCTGQHMVAILWGRKAQELKPNLGNIPAITSPHPSPLSAYRGFFGSKPFSRSNELLQNMGVTPVNWRLP